MSNGFINSWKVENLRLSAFPSNNSQYQFENGWWTDILEPEPDTITSNNKEASYDLVGELKSIENTRLTLHADPSRIDWILAAVQIPSEPPIIGNFTEILDPFKDFTSEWLSSHCPAISRLAFGAILILPTDSKEGSYKQLSAFLDGVIEIDIENSSEFFYQINRPYETSIEIGVKKINKLSKWSAITIKSMVIGTSTGSSRTREIFHGARLELDVNTSADNIDDLPKDILLGIYDELLAEAMKVSDEGDKGT